MRIKNIVAIVSVKKRFVVRFLICASLLATGLILTITGLAQKKPGTVRVLPTPESRIQTYQPIEREVMRFDTVNVRKLAQQEALEPATPAANEIRAIHVPKEGPTMSKGVPIARGPAPTDGALSPQAPLASPTGPSPGPVKTFAGEFLSGGTIPPDTMGAVGTTHVVNVTNDRMRIQTRDGVEVSRVTLTSFWAGVTIKGAAAAAFDPKVYFDRFNSRFILISSGNGQSVNSGALFAVSQTADPTGTWNRMSVVADPTSTAAGGHWIDFPSVGFNKNWIVIMENTFNFGTAGGGFWGAQIFVLDKQSFYANTLGAASLFEDPFTNCTAPFEGKLGCGFTMVPAITEDNTTETEYLVEDWDSTAAQLRLSKITGTAAAPVLTVGTQFPQSVNSWRFNAPRIGTTGGFTPQRQQSANLVSGTRLMGNDSRIGNAVFRNGSLWTTHTVILSTTPQPAGTAVGGAAAPDNHVGVQWWEIDPTTETGLAELPIQRARIEDPTATNCHNGLNGLVATPPCNGAVGNQSGQFYDFPSISVNQNEDVLIGFTQHSAFTYPSAAYAIRRSADAVNTTRDPVVYRPGQSNYNIGAGAGGTAARQNRWGDYSSAQTDPLDDTQFWTVQEYAGTNRNDFLAPAYAGPWETWWAQIDPAAAAPSKTGSLVISEFRLRGPQGVRDEFVELYNPGTSPIIVNTTDNSEGWALAHSTTAGVVAGVGVIPNGTVIPAKGHFLFVNNPDNTAGGTSVLTYSLNGYRGSSVRTANSDTGWAFDLADNGGLAIFKTSTVASFAAGNLMDSVGFSGVPAGLFKEGTGLAPITASTPTGQMSYLRSMAVGGEPKDTGANENDFILVNPVNELSPTPNLGAAGPENLDGPRNRSANVPATLVAPCVAASAAPNRVRVGAGNAGTLSLRRTFTNNTGAPVTRLRFRVIDITTSPAASGAFAILTVATSAPAIEASPCGGPVSLQGLTIEDTPAPAQALGGGYNTTLNAGIVTLAAPLANGATINVDFLTNVVQAGTFRYFLNVEALP